MRDRGRGGVALPKMEDLYWSCLVESRYRHTQDIDEGVQLGECSVKDGVAVSGALLPRADEVGNVKADGERWIGWIGRGWTGC